MKRIVSTFGKVSLGKRAYAVLVLCATAALSLPAQTLTTLHSFYVTDGSSPQAGLVQGTDGNLYGTTNNGGATGGGTVFKITPGGTLTTLYTFCSQSGCADGAFPGAGLVQAIHGEYYGTGDFYGTTQTSEASGGGTLFRITPSGTLTTLYRFPAGLNSNAALVQAFNGDFYGITQYGGTNGYGTVFTMTPSGALTTLYSFCSQTNCTDGAFPYAGLVQATNGDLYGTTGSGGDVVRPSGTVFKITPSGTLTTLYTFCPQTNCTDGALPYAGLVQATNGDLYGTTYAGGANSQGTVFAITQSGSLATLHSFCSEECTDGAFPYAGLVQATDGNLYGTTWEGGGATGGGTVFKMTPRGTLTALYTFCSQGGAGCTDGERPQAGLVQATNGDFYGTTTGGGATGSGTVFSLSTGLGPFVEARPTSGKVGKVIEILGQGLTGTTSVTFNGTAAAFTVVSKTEVTATVPTGATIGRVKVVTPSGTLSSNVPFLVVP
jgi:uncharacterized repeat protein (TIGR03803 family)